MLKSIFICLPKTPGATECELSRNISLMSNVAKIFMWVIIARRKTAMRQGKTSNNLVLSKMQVPQNAVLIDSMLSERAIDMPQDLYLCLIGYSKAFDKVRHGTLLDTLQSLDIDRKDIRVLINLHREQKAGVKVKSKVGRYSNIKKGVI